MLFRSDIVSIGSFFVGQYEHSAMSSLRGHWGLLTGLPLIDAWCRCHLRTVGDPMPHLPTLETSPCDLWAVLLIMVSPTFCTLIGNPCLCLLIVIPVLFLVLLIRFLIVIPSPFLFLLVGLLIVLLIFWTSSLLFTLVVIGMELVIPLFQFQCRIQQFCISCEFGSC